MILHSLALTGLGLGITFSLPFSSLISPLSLGANRAPKNVPLLVSQTSRPGTVPTWSTAKLTQTLDLAHLIYEGTHCPISIPAQALSPDSRTLAISSYSYERSCGGPPGKNSTLTLWDLETGQKTLTLSQGNALEAFNLVGSQAQEPPDSSTSIAGTIAHTVTFTQGGQQVVAGFADGTIKVWNPQTGQLSRTFSGHRYAVHAIALSSPYLVSGSSDRTLKIWNFQTGKLLHTLKLDPSASAGVQTLAIHPQGKTFVSVTANNQVQLWDLEAGRLIRALHTQTPLSNIKIPVAFSPDGSAIATGDLDHHIRLWNSRTGARLLTFKGHQGPVRSLAFKPIGAFPTTSPILASSSDDNTIRFWNLRQNILEHRLTAVGVVSQHNTLPVHRIAFMPEGRTLVIEALLPPSLNDGIPRHGLRLWDVEQQQFIKNIPHTSIATGFSLDHRQLVVGGATLQIWQPQ